MASVAKNIASNLERFGVEDLTIGVSVTKGLRTTTLPIEVKLIELLSAGRSLFGSGSGDFFSTDLSITHDGAWIGVVDTDTRFHFRKAPDLATFLAYAIASDGGRHQILYSFSPTGSAKQLQHTLKPLDGITEPGFELLVRTHKDFKRLLARQFVYRKTSRFADGHYGFVSSAWQIATRDRFGVSIKAPVYYT